MSMRQRRITIVLAMLVLLSGILFPATAQTRFADVPASDWSWAIPAINRMAEKGIINGYDHAATGLRIYEPAGPVTRVQVMVLLYESMRAAGALSPNDQYTSKYLTMMNTAAIPQWAHTHVAYALEKNLLSLEEMGGMMDRSGREPVSRAASREEVAVMFGRALAQKHSLSTSARLSFLDAELISTSAIPYVDLLVRLGIIRGDDTNRFNPRANVRRAEMAIITNNAFNEFAKSDTPIVIEIPTPKEEEKEPPKPDTSRLPTRTWEILRLNADHTILYVINEEDYTTAIDLPFGVTVEIRGREVDRRHLANEVGEKATFYYDSQNRLTRIEVKAPFEGTIRNITPMSGYTSVIVQQGTSSRDRMTFEVDSSTRIQEDGRTLRLSDLQVDDLVAVTYEGEKAVEIQRLFDPDRAEGILHEAVSTRSFPTTLKLRMTGDVVRSFDVEENVLVRINGRRMELRDLRAGDILTLQLRNREVISVEVTRIERTAKETGTIYEILRGVSGRMQMVVTVDGQRITYDNIPANVPVYLDNERSSFAQLEPGYEVTVEVRNGEVYEIEARRITRRLRLEGTINENQTSSGRLILNVREAASSRVERVVVQLTADTIIDGRDGQPLLQRQLQRGDDVDVIGDYLGDVFMAQRVIVY